ncbi:MAG TPA: response regulator, partial [Polyangiaceae bacterium LLY-WYZ-15_(1-7)]|nr:response regulator [Polyangiaceae bacterium LLY-WYZ-15_(1-7)]
MAADSQPQTTVVIVDDEESNLVSLRKIFQKEGVRPLTAADGQEALELCRQHQVHVVLTDLMMPGMSGIDLIKALRTVAPDAETVVMTAYGTIETAVEAMREGAYDFVEKPLKRMQIVKTVRKAAEHHALLRENRTLKQELSVLRKSAGPRAIIG